jgi:hypothetical protein
METEEALRKRVQHEQRLVERLRAANLRFADAQIERTWAIKSAHEAGLSIRQIASATGLSASRVHQVVNTEEPEKIPAWVTDLGIATQGQTPNRLVAEVGLLRQCVCWLHQLEHGEDVMVNMRPDTDRETEYVRFDRPRVMRILERIAADLDQLAQAGETRLDGDPAAEHRRRLAATSEPTRRLSTRQTRNSLRAELKLPPNVREEWGVCKNPRRNDPFCI